MRLRSAASIGACLTLFAACASTDLEENEAGLGLSDLVGDWDNGELFMEIADDGSYRVLEAIDSDPDDPLMGGFVVRDGSDVSFVTDLYGECAGMVGVYSAVVDNDALTLTLVEDPCPWRVARFPEPWDDVG